MSFPRRFGLGAGFPFSELPGGVSEFLNDLPGVDQGRVKQPNGFQPVPEGDHVLVLGSNRPGFVRGFNVGDGIMLTQEVTIGAGKLVRFRGKVRGPKAPMPAITHQKTEPFALSDGNELTIQVDQGDDQIVTFATSDFASIGAARASEVRDAINGQIEGAEAFLTGTGEVGIRSLSTGRHSGIRIVSGPVSALNFNSLAWWAGLMLEGSFKHVLIVRPGEERDLADLGGNLAAYSSPVTVALALKLDLVFF